MSELKTQTAYSIVTCNDESMNVKPSKSSLKQLHEKQLSIYGQSSKEQKDAIVDALGGIDKILQNIFISDLHIEDEAMEKLAHIIGNSQSYFKLQSTTKIKKSIPQNNALNEKHDNGPTVTYEFNDDDMILYKLFNKERAAKIISILSSNITNTILIILFFVS